ncbi:hypothetical protein TetV_508 [Tetraselmis virus 1]|uniref:Uncharacterized protein n=1 Tax=Tetraselmis virus 1 TaxID=2060617 RepID=A0A2P0VNZ8_9VIRU|nr:hypothetical protein QJ968_gp546 [Tetraselmis virus 1]AUF82590.1 hypothetical protein TetV_508 [Tetraselmis virus 1]
MTVAQVLLYVSTTPVIPETATADITNDWLYDNTTTYYVGWAYALRYYWVKVIDNGANESFFSLGSYRTQDNTDPVVTGSLNLGVPTTTQVVFNHSISDNSNQFTSVHVLLTTDSGGKSFTDISTSGQSRSSSNSTTTFDALTTNTTYYGWVAVEDAAGNRIVFDGGSITTDPDTDAPILNSYNFAATAGFEETHVDITLNITDPVTNDPVEDLLTLSGYTSTFAVINGQYTITSTYGTQSGTGLTRTFSENDNYSIYKNESTKYYVIYDTGSGNWVVVRVAGEELDSITEGQSYNVGTPRSIGSETDTHKTSGRNIPEADDKLSYALPNYNTLVATGLSSQFNLTYSIVSGKTGYITGTFPTYTFNLNLGSYDFYKNGDYYVIWNNTDSRWDFLNSSTDLSTASTGVISFSSSVSQFSDSMTHTNTQNNIPNDSNSEVSYT